MRSGAIRPGRCRGRAGVGPVRDYHWRNDQMKRSKAYRRVAELVDPQRVYTPLEAANLAKQTATTAFDATVEVAMRLGVDPRKADQMVRGTVNLPHGTGKTARVAVFAVGEKAEEATAAGADVVGSDDLIEKIQGGFLDSDGEMIELTWAELGSRLRAIGARLQQVTSRGDRVAILAPQGIDYIVGFF